jgi:pheromone shutdown protein TraB
VTVWERKDRILYLLGTAHISTSSAELAAQLVRDIQPNAVFVELDLKRFQKLGRSNRLPNMPSEEKIVIPKVPAPPSEDSWPLRLGGSLLAFILRGMYKLAARRGFKPGEEFVLAVKEGQRVGAAVVVGDMDEDVIVRRLAQALLKTDLWKLLTADSESEELMKELRHEGVSSSTEGKTSEEELEEFVEAMKRRDRVRKIASRYQEIAPSLLQVLLTDRDTYMAAGLETLDHYPVVVAVMGTKLSLNR